MLLDEVVSLLTSTGVAVAKLPGSTSTISWTIYKSLLPDRPDTAIVLTETSGEPPYGRFDAGRPTFQVRVRGARIDRSTSAYSDARAKIEEIKAALHARAASTLYGSYYAGIWAEQDAYALGYDENNRPELVVNFRTARDST